MTRVLIVDDHSLIRRELRALIEQRSGWEVCGEAADGSEGIQKHRALRPHVTVMDFNMPTLNGLQAARQILTESPHACILMLTISDSPGVVEEARRTGIKGFCSKNGMESFMEAMDAVSRGESFFQPN